MNSPESYSALAQAYTDGVRVLFAPSGQPTGERGGHGPAAPEELLEQAEQLEPISAALTQAASVQLEDSDPAVRVQASESLLAKALTDLEVSAYLFQIAEDLEHEKGWVGAEGTERDASGLGETEERLKIILGESRTATSTAERGETEPQDIPTARLKLSEAIEDTLARISKQASKTGQNTLNSLLGLGVTEVAKAAGLVGMNIAQVVGQAETVSRLYNAFSSFAVKAYESLLALLGKQLAEAAAKKMLGWLDEIRNGQLFSEILERIYQTEQTGQTLTNLTKSSEVALNRFLTAIRGLNGLDASYNRQINLAEKVLKILGFLSLVPAAAMPQARLLLAASYLVLGSYIIVVGGDCVDAQRLQRLDRIPGVRRIVETNIATA